MGGRQTITILPLKANQIMNKIFLICMVGLPQSGKSTWAQSRESPIVNPDSIRIALHGQAYIPEAEPMVWAIAKYMVRSLFLAGHDTVILDATNATRKRRDDWSSDHWETVFKVIDTPADICAQRARKSGQDVLIPVIEGMQSRFEALGEDEIQWIEDMNYTA